MNHKALLSGLVLSFALVAIGCGGASTTTVNTTANTNANTAVAVVSNTADNPTLNAPQPSPVANSAVPGIPNAPANLAVSKEDPTRKAKPQLLGRPAPDNSEITTSLAQDVVQTRTFKNHAQLAKVEVIGNEKKTIKVYLRNGQVRELPEGKVGDALSESADNILRAVASGGVAPQTKPETKAPVAESETIDLEKKVKNKLPNKPSN